MRAPRPTSGFRHCLHAGRRGRRPLRASIDRSCTGRCGHRPLRGDRNSASGGDKKTGAATVVAAPGFGSAICPDARISRVGAAQSRSSDCRIDGACAAFSVSQWRTFVPAHGLRDHSGGTVRGLHPISYSPPYPGRKRRHFESCSIRVKYTNRSAGCQERAPAAGQFFDKFIRNPMVSNARPRVHRGGGRF